MISRINISRINSVAVALLLVVLTAQSASVGIDQPYAGDRNVTGQGNYLGKSDSVDQ